MAVDLTAPWDLADIVFVIEDKKLYVNKTILMMSSDVFRTMFTADFREKDQTEIPLPGKTFDSFLRFMKVIHPPHTEVNDKNVQQLLPLAHEYGICHVTSACEKVLLTEPPSVQNLVLAARYSLQQLYKACLTYTQHTPLTQLEAQPGFDQLQPETMIEVLRNKVLQTEVQQEPEVRQEAEGTEPGHEPKAERGEVEPSKEFIYELISKPPSVDVLVLGEKYNIPPVIHACINHLKNRRLTALKAEPGYNKITPATLIQILDHKLTVLSKEVANMEPQVEKLRKLEREVTSAQSILTQVKSLENNEKKSQDICSQQERSMHTAGSLYRLTYNTHGCSYTCSSCQLSVMKDIRGLCEPLLQRLSRIK